MERRLCSFSGARRQREDCQGYGENEVEGRESRRDPVLHADLADSGSHLG